jgi:hypothetical protein
VTRRKTAGKLALMADAIGGPADAARKVGRLARTLAGYLDRTELDRRLSRLEALGIVEERPTLGQLVAGSADMLRFWISPAAADYYEAQGIDYAFHQVLRFLDEPASLADPVGFFSSRDGIIGHLMQVVHANPRYDLELLCMHERGIEELDDQLEQMLAGTHPRARSIGAIVEEPDYHERLLAYVRAFRADPTATPPLRSNVEGDARFREVERTFGSLRTSMRYFVRLPADLPGALLHLRRVKTFPSELAEPSDG